MKTTLRLTIAAFVLGAFNLSAATDPLVSCEPLNPLPMANPCGPESDVTLTVIGASGWRLNKPANRVLSAPRTERSRCRIDRSFPIFYGEDVRCWWESPNDPSEIKRGRVAWRGSNPPATEKGATVRLYLSTWDNPRPDVEVETIDLVSDLTGAAPFVVAITVE